MCDGYCQIFINHVKSVSDKETINFMCWFWNNDTSIYMRDEDVSSFFKWSLHFVSDPMLVGPLIRWLNHFDLVSLRPDTVSYTLTIIFLLYLESVAPVGLWTYIECYGKYLLAAGHDRRVRLLNPQKVIQPSFSPITNSSTITPSSLPRIPYRCTTLHPLYPSNPTLTVTHTPSHRLRSIPPRPRCFLRVTRLSSLRTLLHGNSVGGLRVTTPVGLIQ